MYLLSEMILHLIPFRRRQQKSDPTDVLGTSFYDLAEKIRLVVRSNKIPNANDIFHFYLLTPLEASPLLIKTNI